ncbi:MAG: hypothetical protein WGN25_06745 [Candidatus Electrothrix sp. GW3-4]|uniref:hypothetical protein n=1 Tax=Candidatus Electrothrix sp. GW3-4 TaxID=3126740 RepID=UPI0030D26FC1
MPPLFRRDIPLGIVMRHRGIILLPLGRTFLRRGRVIQAPETAAAPARLAACCEELEVIR